MRLRRIPSANLEEIFVYKTDRSAVFDGTAEIWWTEDLLEKVLLAEWYFHDVVFTHPHEGLHSPIPFGFLPISLGAAINLG